MSDNPRVMIMAGEMGPFAKVGGLADVIQSLPKALMRAGCNVSVLIPFHNRFVGSLKWETAGPSFTISYSGLDRVFTPYQTEVDGVKVYSVRCDELFDRDRIYGCEDDTDRFILLSRAALEFALSMDDPSVILHANDWHLGLVPFYLRTVYSSHPKASALKTVYTIHNLAYQGLVGEEYLAKIGVGREYWNPESIEFWGKVNIMKGGVVNADRVTTVSPNYAQEIQTPEFGEGLDGLLYSKREKLLGILNGIDYDYWNPDTDPLISPNFSRGNPDAKRENRTKLRKELGMPERIGSQPAALIGMVTRMVAQKGFDITIEAVPEMVRLPIQLVVLGTGSKDYEVAIAKLSEEWPEQIAAVRRFDEEMAHRIYAASDFFLMPSKFEPCGLGQMIAMRYGTVPIVRMTGGLADTVKDFSGPDGTGVVFKEYSASALLKAVSSANDLFRDRERFERVIDNCFSFDSSWGRSAQQYIELYRSLAG